MPVSMLSLSDTPTMSPLPCPVARDDAAMRYWVEPRPVTSQTIMDKCGTLSIAVYTNVTWHYQSTAPLVFQEEIQPLISLSRTLCEDFSDQVSDVESCNETDSEAECSEKKNDNDFFTHMSPKMTRSGRRVKAVSKLDL